MKKVLAALCAVLLLTSTAQFIFAHTVRRRLLRTLPPQEALT